MSLLPGSGVLLLFTGSPSSPDRHDVAQYLRKFLSDPSVLNLPFLTRSLLVRGIIVPLRAGKSAIKYRQIWQDEGAPLSHNTLRFQKELEKLLPECTFALGSSYGVPDIKTGVEYLLHHNVKQIVAFPLFPHYTAATCKSPCMVLETLWRGLRQNDISLFFVPPFYDHPAYINAFCSHANAFLTQFQPDHVVFSYHGLPIKQAYVSYPQARGQNYVQQCLRTTELLSSALSLTGGSYSHAYQSRFGRGWLIPLTSTVLQDLAHRGIKRVAVLSPSFIADCLETLYELDVEVKTIFLEAGGEEYLRIPALNDAVPWVQAAAQIIETTIKDWE